ncbi:MAG: hypothetical protein R6U52_07735 [Kosmotogaceae bacterium]
MKKILFITIVLMIALTSFGQFIYPDIRPGYGVTETKWLSDYFEPLKDTNLDTPVFIMDSGNPGATFLLMGGTHPREIAGTTSALVFMENAVVTTGRVIVIPFSNRSAASVEDQSTDISHFIQIETRSGPRYLIYGDRRTDIEDQGIDDPKKYVHDPSGMVIDNGAESRNLNRNYPGKPDGNPTQQLAYAILELIRQEDVDFNLDMHESDTPRKLTDSSGGVYEGGRLAYMLVCHPTGLELGAISIMEMEDIGIPMKLEESNKEFRGLSHREIGDNTDCISFLSESPNPGQERYGEDKDVISDPDYPLKHRVGMHIELIKKLFSAYNLYFGTQIEVENLPEYDELMEKDVGHFLN